MMKKFFLTALLLPAFLGALEITECRSIAGGKTRIAWKNAPEKYVMVYRYSEKITAQNIFFATRKRYNAADGSCLITPKSAGNSYYLLTSCDQFGKEKRDFSIQAGPVRESAAVQLAAIDFRVKSGKNGTSLVWEPLALEYRGMVRELQLVDRKGEIIARGDTSTVEFPMPVVKAGDDREYTVVAVGIDGGKSAVKGYFRYGDFPDFMISPESNAVKNPDIFMESRYQLTGRKNKLAFQIINCGGKAGSAVVKVPGGGEEKITLAPGTSVKVPCLWQPEKRGLNRVSVNIVCPADRQQSSNRTVIDLYAVDKPLWFLWYGAASELDFATCGTDAPEHWKRIGGKQLRICVANKDVGYYRSIFRKDSQLDGLQYDELGGTIDPKEYIAALREFRKTHPDVFIALWNIGARLQPEIVAALKDGTIDLVMPERYHTYNAPMEESLRKDIEHLRKLGVLDKTIIGLGTHRNYAGYGNAQQHLEYLEKQIALIRKLAPESPGMAFYNTATLPGVKEKVDGLCKKYFLEERETK